MKHYNPSLADHANRLFNSKGEFLPPEVNDSIQATKELAADSHFCRNASGTSISADVTIFTTPPEKDFYLRSINWSVRKDATWDGGATTCGVNVTIRGVTRTIGQIAISALTAENFNINQFFGEQGIRLDRNTTVRVALGAGGTVGTMTRTACVQGYTEEVTK